MEKIKQYRFIILVALIILGFTFYWFEWRPSQIRIECWKKVKIMADKAQISILDTERLLNLCLAGKGLNK